MIIDIISSDAILIKGKRSYFIQLCESGYLATEELKPEQPPQAAEKP